MSAILEAMIKARDELEKTLADQGPEQEHKDKTFQCQEVLNSYKDVAESVRKLSSGKKAKKEAAE